MTDETQNQVSETTTNGYLVPAAIVIAGIFIAGAIFFTNNGDAVAQPGGRVLEAVVAPITEKDHVYGSRDADVFLVEYSDYRCGFCGMFHATIKEVLERYDGKVAWVYRHLPFQPGGQEAAVAAECVAELKGEDAFWQFTEKALENTRELSPEWHLATAQELGIDGAAFTECFGSGRHDATIAAHKMNGQEIGANGTPYNVLLTRKGDMIPFSGAQPIDSVGLLVERALRSLE